MKLLTTEREESYETAKICYIYEEKFGNKYIVRNEYRGAAHSICNLKYSVSEKIPKAFHNGSNYDYHFIIKELAKELGENTEKYISNRRRS